MLAMVPVVAATVAAVWASLFLQYFVLMDAVEEIKRLRAARARKRPVLIWAACAFMFLGAACQVFFQWPVLPANQAPFALAAMCICGALGCFWLHIWGDYKHLRDGLPDRLWGVTALCGVDAAIVLSLAADAYGFLFMVYSW